MEADEKQARMRALIERYFEACNHGDVDAIASCFTLDAIHYFPPGMYGGALRSSSFSSQPMNAA